MHAYTEEEEEVIIMEDSHRKEMNMKMIFFFRERHAKAKKGKMIENNAIHTQSERKGIQIYTTIL